MTSGDPDIVLRELVFDLTSVPHLVQTASPPLPVLPMLARLEILRTGLSLKCWGFFGVDEGLELVIRKRSRLGEPRTSQKTGTGNDKRALASADHDIDRAAAKASADLFNLYRRCELVDWENIHSEHVLTLLEFVASYEPRKVSSSRGRPRNDPQRSLEIATSVFEKIIGGVSRATACSEVADARTDRGMRISEDGVQYIYRQFGQKARLSSRHFLA
jgi:hypothetical protein